MELRLIENIHPDTWDMTISNYDSKYLFHNSSWLKLLEETNSGKAVKFEIIENGAVIGYFSAVLIKKGPFRILGSPLQGWTTNYMGPIVNKGFDTKQFVNALDEICRIQGIHHVELCNPILDNEIMHKQGFDITEGITYIVPLSTDEDKMWKRCHRTKCRQAINRARRNGLIVEDNYNISFTDEFYEELKEVFAKQGLVPTYSIERVKKLFSILTPDQFFSLQVKHDSKIIATGIFLHDDRSVIGFGATSWREFQGLNPNELLWWELITRAAQMGLKQLDMSGKGSFKPKFGGDKMTVYKYSKSYSYFAKAGREAYKSLFYIKQKMKGKYFNYFKNRKKSS